MENANQLLSITEQFAVDGFEVAREYFKKPGNDMQAEHAKSVLKAIDSNARLQMAKAKHASLALDIAKHMNLDGSALAPVWETLTGQKVPISLPVDGERLDAAQISNQQNQ